MDRFLARLARLDGDLVVSETHGFAYQHDMSLSVSYADDYFDKYVGYEGTEIAKRINAARVSLVNRHAGPDAGILDIGIGSGEFIKSRPNTFGFDINPKAVAWLKGQKRWSDSFCVFEGFTFWDVLEHVREPESYFRKIQVGAFLFVSIPVFDSVSKVKKSKHYRPNEHYYYFTEQGFVNWMFEHRFRLLEANDHETKAGREGIMSFAFRKCPN